jgi:hypothetical protein
MWVVAAANKNLRQSRQRVFEQLGAFLTSNSYSQPAVSDLFHSPLQDSNRCKLDVSYIDAYFFLAKT